MVAAWFIVKKVKKNKEKAHRRMSDDRGFRGSVGDGAGPGYDRAALRSPTEMEEERRRSFFFAEDSLRGYGGGRTGPGSDDDHSYTRHTPAVHRRVPVNASAISAPILRESSLNW